MRTIHCHVCGKYLGEIRDAKVMKGIAYLCPTCQKPKESSYDLPPGWAEMFGVNG